MDLTKLVKAPDTPVGRVVVAAAMIAATEQYGANHYGVAGYLWDPYEAKQDDSSGMCIQGAMLTKLGHDITIEDDGVEGGSEEVMTVLGYAVGSRTYDKQLRWALDVAEYANDEGLPWGAALEAFERVLAGESATALTHEIDRAVYGQHELDRKGYEKAVHDEGMLVWVDEMVTV